MFALTRNPFLKFSAAGSSTEGRETVRQILIEMLSKNDAIEMLSENDGKVLHQLLRGLRQNQSPTGDKLIAILKWHPVLSVMPSACAPDCNTPLRRK